MLQIVTCDFGKLISRNYFLQESFCIRSVSSVTPHGFLALMDSPTCLGSSRSLLLVSSIKTHQVSALEIQFSCSVDNCHRGEPSHLFLGMHCSSHLFLSYLNTMGLMIFKSSHMLTLFLLLARISFVPVCYPDSLHPYIATENSFFLWTLLSDFVPHFPF